MKSETGKIFVGTEVWSLDSGYPHVCVHKAASLLPACASICRGMPFILRVTRDCIFISIIKFPRKEKKRNHRTSIVSSCSSHSSKQQNFWNMGVPLPSSNSAQTGFHCSPSQGTAHGDAANSVADDVFSSTGVPHHVFVYGDLRPDAPGNSQLLSALPNQRAWLLGSRLYSVNAEGNRRAAVKLEEYGHAVFGYAVSSNNSMGISRILAECERAEHSPDSYERDVVEVITERGERLQSYIYHQADVNPSHLVPSGDWLRQ